LLVGGQLGVEFGELDIEALDAGVDLGVLAGRASVEAGMLTLEMAEVSVGLGAVLFAPKRRFMVGTAVCYAYRCRPENI